MQLRQGVPPLAPLEPAAEQRPRSQQEERSAKTMAERDSAPVDARGVGAEAERDQVLQREVGRAIERGERDCVGQCLTHRPHQPLPYLGVSVEEPHEANGAEDRQAAAPAGWLIGACGGEEKVNEKAEKPLANRWHCGDEAGVLLVATRRRTAPSLRRQPPDEKPRHIKLA